MCAVFLSNNGLNSLYETLVENRDLKIRILEIEGLRFLWQGEYEMTEKRFKGELDLFLKIQEDEDVWIHKDTPYHNLGICLRACDLVLGG